MTSCACSHVLCPLVFSLALCCPQVSLESRGPEAFKTPKGVCVPFGSMELALAQRPAYEQQRFASLLAANETAGLAELDGIASEMQVRRCYYFHFSFSFLPSSSSSLGGKTTTAPDRFVFLAGTRLQPVTSQQC